MTWPRGELTRVDEVDGRQLLLAALERSNEAFCVCTAALKYLMGFYEAQGNFEVARRKKLVVVVSVPIPAFDGIEETLYVPPAYVNGKEPELEMLATPAVSALQRAYGILAKAYPDYKPGKLRELPEEHKKFVQAFGNLRLHGYLPRMTSSCTYNHQGMVMLMDRCFSEESDLIDFLRAPNILGDPLDAFVRASRTLDEALDQLGVLVERRDAGDNDPSLDEDISNQESVVSEARMAETQAATRSLGANPRIDPQRVKDTLDSGTALLDKLRDSDAPASADDSPDGSGSESPPASKD